MRLLLANITSGQLRHCVSRCQQITISRVAGAQILTNPTSQKVGGPQPPLAPAPVPARPRHCLHEKGVLPPLLRIRANK